MKAKIYFGIALALFSIVVIAGGVEQIIQFILALMFLLSGVICLIRKPKKIAEFLSKRSFDNLALFLGLFALAVALLPKSFIFGIIVFVIAYVFLAWDIGFNKSSQNSEQTCKEKEK